MTPADKIKKIVEAIEVGRTVYFSTPLRSYAVNLKTFNKFKKAGYDLFKADGDSLMMMSGKNYLCVDGCKIEVS